MRRVNVLLLDEQDAFVRKFKEQNKIKGLDEAINKVIEVAMNGK